ncbi:MAG: hypothetical protein HQK83_13465 [Fibrobacteria bacterium]|nr:hypothetical protein [Fibrobacteria bacterium]
MTKNYTHQLSLCRFASRGMLWKVCLVGVLYIFLCHSASFGLEKRDRFSGLNRIQSSSTMGKGNLFLSMYGRAFLWDNNAAGRIPTMYPHVELGYGFFDFMQVSGGLQIMTTKPGMLFGKIKLTLPNNKRIRLLGLGMSLGLYKSLVSEFKSNGFRYENEGFSPDSFILGNSSFITFFRAVFSADVELIRLVSFLPFKFYMNMGYEGSNYLGSWMGDNADKALDLYANNTDTSGLAGSYIGTSNFSKLPLMLGAELKTHYTDFFLEIETEPFYEHIKQLINGTGNNRYWVRYNIVLGGGNLRVVDIHLLETPIYVNLGGRLKYANGMSLQGGFSWLLSKEFGTKIGPCIRNDACKEGATDGFSPFYPQWRLFGRVNYPIKFKQTSAELYRTYLLRKNRKIRKVIDIDKSLRSSNQDESPNIDITENNATRQAEIIKEQERAKDEKID